MEERGRDINQQDKLVLLISCRPSSLSKETSGNLSKFHGVTGSSPGGQSVGVGYMQGRGGERGVDRRGNGGIGVGLALRNEWDFAHGIDEVVNMKTIQLHH